MHEIVYSNLMKYSTIIFDFDGTIADTFTKLVEINNRLYKELGTDPIDSNETLQLKEHAMRDWFKIIEIPIYKIPFFIRTIIEELHKDVETVKAFDGIAQILKKLKKENVLTGIVTTDSVENVRKFLKSHGLEQYFEFVNSADFIAGKTFALNRLINQYKLVRSKTLYIGDTTRDIKNSKHVKIDIAAVTWGYNTKRLLSTLQPTYLVETPQELEKVIFE
jgi:phosphoglycolate phosphatase